MAAIGFAFFYFIFLKIYCGIAFDTGISLVGALISAIVISAIEIVPAAFFTKALVGAQFESMTGRSSHAERRKLWASYIGVLPVMVFAVVLISIGFSENFFEDELDGRYRDFLGLDWESIGVLTMGIVLMTLPNIIMTHIGLRSVGRGDLYEQ